MAEVVARKGRNRKPLKTLSANDVNISAGKPSSSPYPSFVEAAKENREGLSLLLSPKKSKKGISKQPKSTATEKSFTDELQELQARLKELRIEKEKTEELLKERDQMLKLKEEELENRGKEQEKLQKEFKKLQKSKEFNPTMNLPLVKSLREKEQEKNENNQNKKKKKNKGQSEKKKKPSPPYILWCKDRWNEVKKENPEADFKETANILGAKWKNLSAEDKKPYEEKYRQEKEAYLQIVRKEKRENEAMSLLEEEQMQKTAMELLEQYLQFKQEAEKEGKKKQR